MRNQDLSELPRAPSNKSGWPWEADQKSKTIKSVDADKNLPKISIVTPTYNQGHFIEETIRSILLQGYPNLEYIIIDGGSSDQTVEIIKKYEAWISYWVSEPDQGQANAINKGVERASGDIIQWINSDDYLEPSALWHIARSVPSKGIAAFAIEHFGLEYTDTVSNKNIEIGRIFSKKTDTVFRQPAVWMSRDAFLSAVPLNENLHFSFDWEFLLRAMCECPSVVYSDLSVLRYRHHPESKTVASSHKWLNDGIDIYSRLLQESAFQPWAHEIRRILAELKWKAELLQIRKKAKPKAIATLLFKMALDPGVRLNRFSLGAARRILTSKPDADGDKL